MQPCLELELAIFRQARYLPQNVHPLQVRGQTAKHMQGAFSGVNGGG